MKQLKILSMLILLCLGSYAQNFNLLAASAVTKQPIKFRYVPNGLPVSETAKLSCKAYIFSSGLSPKIEEVTLLRDGEQYNGEILTTDSTTFVAFGFFAGGKKDEEPKGYLVQVAKSGVFPAESYVNRAYFVSSGMGNYYVGLKTDHNQATADYVKAFEIKPQLREKYEGDYYTTYFKADKEKATVAIKQKLTALKTDKSFSETSLTLAMNLYSIIKNKTASDSLKLLIIEKYPKGNISFNTDLNTFYGLKDLALAEKKYDEMVAKYELNPMQKNNEKRSNSVNQIMAGKFNKAEDVERFESYVYKVSSKLSKASLYNEFVWKQVEHAQTISPVLPPLSKKSLDYVEEAKSENTPANYSSKDAYLKSLDQTYGMYADTYALSLYRAGNFKDALAYQEKSKASGVAISADMKERYITYLIKNGNSEKAWTAAEEFVKTGKASDSTKSNLKTLFTGLKKTGDFEDYYAGLLKVAYEKDKAVWAKRMINDAAPDFSLVNLKGETVQLSALKGKTVILDYWATWCGPCVASFPGMQLAMHKYKDNPNIVFLFLNTFQREKNREEVVNEFLKNGKYPFNVLYDTKNKEDETVFDVASAYNVTGIPTKFLIGPDGNIKFKFVGYSGSDQSVARELEMMISLANETTDLAKSR